ncbi:hypothetical protein [Streptomyces sp. MAR4 CNX-425]|uniref:hypothetical protein n=1 Tax=Streptomyces sp. MAR4 CNX-425 TaxID=3406343 RepID=UPI003B504FC2
MRSLVRSSRAGLSAAVIGVVAAAVLAGCGSDTDDAAEPGDGDTATVSPSPTDGKSASTSPSATPETGSPSPEFTPLAPEDAADGTDVGACADGKCEVAVTAGTDIPFDADIGGVRVAEVSKSEVTLALTSGFIQVGIGPEGGSFGNVNTEIIDFGVLGIEDGTAVISFATEKS